MTKFGIEQLTPFFNITMMKLLRGHYNSLLIADKVDIAFLQCRNIQIKLLSSGACRSYQIAIARVASWT